jgi:hypothetical protein
MERGTRCIEIHRLVVTVLETEHDKVPKIHTKLTVYVSSILATDLEFYFVHPLIKGSLVFCGVHELSHPKTACPTRDLALLHRLWTLLGPVIACQSL